MKFYFSKNELLKKRKAFYECVLRKNRFPSNNFKEVYQLIDIESDFIFYSEHALDGPFFISSSFLELFERVNFLKYPCYWISVEPFKFFIDIDLYVCDIKIESVLKVISKYCDKFLVCQSVDLKDPTRESYSVFTDSVVSFQQAECIEQKIALEVIGNPCKLKQKTNYFENRSILFPEGPIDAIYFTSNPFTYRRAPFSIHGLKKIGDNRITIARTDLSNLPKNMTQLDLFKFSYPNICDF